MALSDHHYTSPPFHLHLIILISPRGSVRASRVCVLCVIMFYFLAHAHTRTHAHARTRAPERESECGRRKKKDEGRKGREWCVHMIQPLHLMQVPFAPYCLSHCWKKAGDLPSLKRQLIPFPLARLFVCLFVFVRALCVCLWCVRVHVRSTSIQTTVAFACVQ